MIKVLIDPGHVGGNVDDLRAVAFSGKVLKEGDLSYLWAEELQKSLNDHGFAAELTRARGQYCQTPTELQIDRRRQELEDQYGSITSILNGEFNLPESWRLDRPEAELVDLLIANQLDLQARRDFNIAHRCHLMISLHLNGSENLALSDDNGICGFTNHDSKKMFPLFNAMIQEICQTLNLDPWHYQKFEQVGPGLFIRDLVLMRQTHTPLLLLEGPFQTNSKYFELFTNPDTTAASELFRRISMVMVRNIHAAFAPENFLAP